MSTLKCFLSIMIVVRQNVGICIYGKPYVYNRNTETQSVSPTINIIKLVLNLKHKKMLKFLNFFIDKTIYYVIIDFALWWM